MLIPTTFYQRVIGIITLNTLKQKINNNSTNKICTNKDTKSTKHVNIDLMCTHTVLFIQNKAIFRKIQMHCSTPNLNAKCFCSPIFFTNHLLWIFSKRRPFSLHYIFIPCMIMLNNHKCFIFFCFFLSLLFVTSWKLNLYLLFIWKNSNNIL